MDADSLSGWRQDVLPALTLVSGQWELQGTECDQTKKSAQGYTDGVFYHASATPAQHNSSIHTNALRKVGTR